MDHKLNKIVLSNFNANLIITVISDVEMSFKNEIFGLFLACHMNFFPNNVETKHQAKTWKEL